MSIIKRLSATLFSRIDQVVGEIENHDAVIQASLQEMRKRVAEAKVRLTQLHREEENLNQQIQTQQQEALNWRQRAKDSVSDETKAMTCLQRSHHAQQQLARFQQALNQYQAASNKLAQDIDQSEQRLSEMKHKLTLMRARESSSSARAATTQAHENNELVLDDAFDRWEINISQTEMAIDDTQLSDPFEQAFIDHEQEAALRSELAQLMKEEEKQ